MLNEHHQTATCVDPAAPLVLGGAGAAHQEGAAPDPRQSGRQPPPAGARRRGDGDGRRALEGPARMRLRARRALRGAAGEQQSRAHERAAVGGDGPHRQGLDQPRRAGEPRGPLLPPPQHQYLAAALSAAASADLGVDAPRRAAPARVGARGYVQATFLTGFDGTPAIYESYRKGWREAGRGGDVPVNRLAYAALVYTGETEAEARAGAEKLLWYMTRQQGAAALLLSAGLRADAGARADPARRGDRPACRATGRTRPSTRRSRPASCSPARPTRSSARSRRCTTTSAASGIC